MAVPNYLREQVYQIRSEANAIMQALEGQAAADMAGFIDRVLAMLGEAIAAGDVTGADSIVAAAEIAIDQIAFHGANVMQQLAGDVFDVSLRSQVATMDAFGTLSARQLAVATQSFSATFRPDLLSNGHRQWYERMSQTLNAPDSLLRKALIESEVYGESLTDVATRLVESGGDAALDPGVDAMRRAKRFVRTESTRVDTATSVTFAESIGVKKFLNMGIGDTRQAPECEFASEQGALTIDEWNKLTFRGVPVGAPPRHPHCRCGFHGVPEPFTPSDDLLISAGIIEEGDRL